MIPGLEWIPESDFEHFSEFDDSDSDSTSGKNRFFYYNGINSKIRCFIMSTIPILIPGKTE